MNVQDLLKRGYGVNLFNGEYHQEPLTLRELQLEMEERGAGFHAWVKLFPHGTVYAAIIDKHDDYGVVGVWCAGSELDFLMEFEYGRTWLAFLEKPDEY